MGAVSQDQRASHSSTISPSFQPTHYPSIHTPTIDKTSPSLIHPPFIFHPSSTHSLTYPFTNFLLYSASHSPVCLSTQPPLVHLALIHPLSEYHPSTQASIHALIHLLTHPSIHHPHIHLPTPLSIIHSSIYHPAIHPSIHVYNIPPTRKPSSSFSSFFFLATDLVMCLAYINYIQAQEVV